MANEKGIVNHFKAVRREVSKTTWPTPEQVKKALAAVFVVVLAYAIMAGVFDFLIGALMDLVLSLKK